MTVRDGLVYHHNLLQGFVVHKTRRVFRDVQLTFLKMFAELPTNMSSDQTRRSFSRD